MAVSSERLDKPDISSSRHRADEGKLGKRLTTLLDLVEEHVGIVRFILGYVQPDFIKVGSACGRLRTQAIR